MAEDPPTETEAQRFARELTEIVSELRLALPGVQLLFGFMLVAPFSERFGHLTHVQRAVFFLGFIAGAAASALMIAPSVYHRLHWRREIADKERMLAIFTVMTIAGAAFLSVAMTSVIFVVTDFLFTRPLSIVVTVGAGVFFVGLWFLLPLADRIGRARRGRAE
jgi:hypothetical protein